jgi:radical SAM protein (TIGR01212 family)
MDDQDNMTVLAATLTPGAENLATIPDKLYPGPYYEYRIFMERMYGKALHKVPVDFNYGCPHRTADHHGGCTFCPEDGSRASQIDGLDTLSEQIEAAVAFAKHRYQATGFTAYVQAYTATFAPVNQFREHMVEILEKFPFDSLHLGTRPDCLPASTLEYLQQLSQQIDLWVELGLQTIHDKTLLRIKREHDWACSLKGIKKLKDKGLQVVSHVILGLPGETHEDMIETAKVMAQQPLDGIKVHNLHVLEKTQLAVEYAEQRFHLMGELEYLHVLAEFLRHLPPDLPVMRINTDTPPKELVAPHWQVQKGQMRVRLLRHMADMGYRQGDLYVSAEGQPSPALHQDPAVKISTTIDGSNTMLSRYHGEAYHPRMGARLAGQQRFIDLQPWEQYATQSTLDIVDIGFGTGLNSLLCLERALAISAPTLNITAFEQDLMSTKGFVGHHGPFDGFDGNQVLSACCDVKDSVSSWSHERGHQITIHWGEARYHLQGLQPGSQDAILLDPFDEKNNTELVSLELMRWLHHLLKDGGVLLSSRTHPAVQQALIMAGFEVERFAGAIKFLKAVKVDVSEAKEPEPHVDESAVDRARRVPYRDPHMCWSHKDIVRERNRQLEVLKN